MGNGIVASIVCKWESANFAVTRAVIRIECLRGAALAPVMIFMALMWVWLGRLVCIPGHAFSCVLCEAMLVHTISDGYLIPMGITAFLCGCSCFVRD